MAKHLEEVWSGWALVNVPEKAGGAEARHRQHLVNRRRQQMAVLELLQETHPGLVRGERDVSVSPEVTEQWQELLQTTGSGSAIEIRNKINFLSLGLLRGKRALGWQVVVPAPMQLVRPAASHFTPESFNRLSEYRDACRGADEAIQQTDFQVLLLHGNENKGHRRLESEIISWGLFLYLVITRDGLLSSKHLHSLPLATKTLAVHKSSAWLVLHDTVPEDMPGKIPPRSRWVLGVSALAVLMRHIHYFGHPDEKVDGYQQAKALTLQAWRHFSRAAGIDKMSLSECQDRATTAFRLHVPSYVVNGALGKHLGTSLAEARWQQLIRGGYVEHAGRETDPVSAELPTRETGLAPVSKVRQARNQPLYEARTLLKSLHVMFYKRRDQKRLTFGEISQELEKAITVSQQMAPIVECLCHWLLFLHRKKKRKQSTLYKYLGVSMPLLQAMGEAEVDQDRLALLVEAYQYVVEQAKTEKNRHYRWTVLRSFHTFLVSDRGLANVYMEFSGDGATVAHHADANCLSEDEYCQVKYCLASRAGSVMGACRHWVFVLGFRAGLRIGEALSIQLDDILCDHALDQMEMTLLIRNNAYMGIKSHDSRRQLPLHLLLTSAELKDFSAFVVNRYMVATHGRVMLFGEGSGSVAPLRDDRVQPDIHAAMRRIIGDPSLRFHHLRHSLANYLLLSFHKVAVPWAVPPHHTALWESVLNGPSRSGLYFVAQVMGHASPDVTLRSYFHFTCLLADHFCHQQLTSVEGGSPRHAVAQPEHLAGVLAIKPARLRKWKERFGDRPSLWLSKAFPRHKVIDVAELEVEPYPVLPAKVLLERQGLSQLSLEQVAAALEALHEWTLEDVEQIFNLCDGEAEGLMYCARRVLTARTRRGKSAFRHYRFTQGKQITLNDSVPPRLPMPHSLEARSVASAMYQSIWAQWFEQTPEELRRYLRFFYRYHRATDGHVWLSEAEDGLAFVSWVLSLSASVRAVVEVVPSALSPLSVKQQLSGWKKCLLSHHHKVEWQLASAGKRYAKPLGTGNVTFYVANQNNCSRSGYPVRYVLVMACIVMAAVARHESREESKYVR